MYGRKYTITVEGYVKKTNAIGEEEKVWSDNKGTVKGKIWQLSGNETYMSNRDTRIVNYRTAFDKPSFEITEEDRLDYNGKKYDIEVVNDLDTRGIRLQVDLKVAG